MSISDSYDEAATKTEMRNELTHSLLTDVDCFADDGIRLDWPAKALNRLEWTLHDDEKTEAALKIVWKQRTISPVLNENLLHADDDSETSKQVARPAQIAEFHFDFSDWF